MTYAYCYINGSDNTSEEIQEAVDWINSNHRDITAEALDNGVHVCIELNQEEMDYNERIHDIVEDQLQNTVVDKTLGAFESENPTDEPTLQILARLSPEDQQP